LIKTVFTIFVMSILITGTLSPMSFAQSPGLDKIRVIAHDGPELSKAIENGCKVVREAGPLNGIICKPKVAESLGLRADMKLYAVDVDANSQIGADSVQLGGNTGVGAKVAILDTGYNYNHIQLSSSYLGGHDYVNNDSDPLDDDGHGSHVAGIVTSDAGRSIGVANSAGVYSYKVLDENGSGSFTDTLAALQDIVWGPDNTFGTGDDNSVGVDAINLSLGSQKPNVWKGTCDTVWPEMTTVIQDAKTIGIAVVIAAGNDGRSGVSFPGCISDAITVASVDSKDKVARSSGVGTSVDIAARGVSIYSTYLGTGYAIASGTSMATPMITGTVALMKSANNALSVNEIESALFATATDLGDSGKDTKYGHGRVNADLAVAYSPGPVNNPPTVTISNPNNGDNPLSGSTITFTATANDAEDNDVTLTGTISWTSSKDGSIGSGGSVSKTLTDGSHTITAQVTDSGGKTSNDSVTITVGEAPLAEEISVNQIIYGLTGGKNGDRHLLVTIHVIDNLGQDVSGSGVSVTMERDTPPPFMYTGSATTGADGKVTFQLSNAKSGCYTTTVAVDSTDWDGLQPQDGLQDGTAMHPSTGGFCKS
jgi:hypothetical protein